MDEYTKITSSISKIESDLTNDLLSAGYITGLIVGIIGFVILLIEINTYYKIHSINKWPIIKNGGTIRDSYMESSSGSTTYSIFVISKSFYNLSYRTRASFTYKINDKIYISNKISYYEPWETNPMYAKIETDLLKKDSKVDIRVNPHNPNEAYIYNKPYDIYITLLIGIILSLIGVYVIYKM